MRLEEMLSQLSVDMITEHVKWLTTETPARISGLGQDRKAAEYISGVLRDFGLESGIHEFEAYNSIPGAASLEVVSPFSEEVPCLPCAHITSTPPGGIEAELVYVGAGGEEDYRELDVRGKVVLAEVSYAPATPEKARIAWRKGAAGIILGNWGTEEQDVICMRALKGVWGNPTTRTFEEIPQVAGVTVSRPWGERLAQACREGRVLVRLVVSSERRWDRLGQPFGIVRGAVEPDKYVLVSGHLDAWEPGVTCNATGNATMLEIARVLAKSSPHLRRSVYFAFWNGHEIAEAAGSSWFVDTFWPSIARNCVAYINIDSTGMKDTSLFRVSASRELSCMVEGLSSAILGEPVHVSPLARTGDQSFFGVGVPAVSGRYSFSDEYVRRTHGATLGWWNHTVADTLDKYDPRVMAKDVRVQAAYVWSLATLRRLPYRFAPLVEDMRAKVDYIAGLSRGIVDLDPIKAEVDRLGALVTHIDSLNEGELSDRQIDVVNRVSMRVSRCLTNAFYTSADRFEQDSYGLSVLSKPIPVLFRAVDLAQADPAAEEFKLLRTELWRARNRVWDAVNSAVYAVEDALNILGANKGDRK